MATTPPISSRTASERTLPRAQDSAPWRGICAGSWPGLRVFGDRTSRTGVQVYKPYTILRSGLRRPQSGVQFSVARTKIRAPQPALRTILMSMKPLRGRPRPWLRGSRPRMPHAVPTPRQACPPQPLCLISEQRDIQRDGITGLQCSRSVTLGHVFPTAYGVQAGACVACALLEPLECRSRWRLVSPAQQ